MPSQLPQSPFTGLGSSRLECEDGALLAPHLPLASGPRTGRSALTISRSRLSGPCHAILLLEAAWLFAEARMGLHPLQGTRRGARAAESRSRGAAPAIASQEPAAVPAVSVVSWGRRAGGSDSAAGLLSGLCQGAGSWLRSLGSRKPAWGAPSGPAPPDAACCSGRRRLPVNVTLSSARENSMLAPSRRGPHPFTSHPPLPSWQGDWEKAASFESAQRLWSCPGLSAINHGASDFCFASEGGVGTPA